MLNRVVLVGRMTRDPELRRTGSGSAVTNFTIALNRNFTSSTNGQQTDFIPCVVWNKVAENVAKYCAKGSLVGVEGRLQSRQYQNQEGRNVTVIEVICDSVQFLESKGARERNTNYAQNSYQPTSTFVDPPAPEPSVYDMQSIDLDKDFDNSMNTFDIMEDDIQF